ncbi:DMT family transporter [Georgenia thermotolerans]|uniref:EamA family transporter n=1 Tax=Georgenia thermotolerans TaxID=527326 RepID=A0A7J5US12_9MICO|nr:DMT family transporter [Georgenia thermotolerans]KAE8765031.1 EamA family transporter [Georgenia thermotolerans]
MGQVTTGRGTAIKFAALALMWGSSFLFIRVAVGALAPAQVALGRLVVGAATLALIMTLTRRRWPREARVLGHLAVVAVLLCVVPFLLFSWAGQHIPSGLSSIYNATTPIMTLLVSLVALPQERLTAVRTAALALAAAGVVVIAAPWMLGTVPHGENFGLGQLAALGATACYGTGFVYLRCFLAGVRYDAVTVAATQVGIGALIMLALAPFIARAPVHLDGAVLASVLALGALSTGIAYIWNFDVVRAWGATAASTVTYLTPVVGVVLGALVLGERLSLNEPLGAVLVILGIVVGQGHVRLARRPRKAGARTARRGPHGAGAEEPVPSEQRVS